MKGDLHTHTFHSDGSCSPERVFELAKRTGLGAVAVTDHDYIADFSRDEALSVKYGITALHGVEMSTYDNLRQRRVHILCYFPADVSLIRSICEKTAERRNEAGLEMAKMVAKEYPITVADVQREAAATGCIYKQHIMDALMKAGYATEMYGALYHKLFDGETGSCYRACVHTDVWEGLKQFHKAGCICVMAHPFTYDSIDILKDLTDAKLLDGVEVWQSKTNKLQEEQLFQFAQAKHLIPTGGSDFHGRNAARVVPIGAGTTPSESIEAILALRQSRQGR